MCLYVEVGALVQWGEDVEGNRRCSRGNVIVHDGEGFEGNKKCIVYVRLYMIEREIRE